MIRHYNLTLARHSRGYHVITSEIFNAVNDWPETGLLQVFIQHTSAAITINEAADPDVLVDFETMINRLVPENQKGLVHTIEGPDDMPAHIKASIIGTSISVPIIDGRPALGTWQGIYLCEFRNYASARRLVISVIS